ncbi:OVARIAN TUMOR DOMAIN-containing deubiquitinating enzyme 7 isoform X1 [Alnus glutinosa]|uniref:OVARIAN TUMOR DOMAIN-containing deubiquitinating enzyme 7 isoform X1 n=2 Tax=Alnus glutinosa TaxID=3517 RepID=UPI002D79B04E|nr:OVARIAN TUMOR DOMAIN-containing deubiquitinating enzyme 7 isoform X1 [Alnus glutinosa]XP_062154314.1 OVARIAN TUMOR DOMAIN-containing deubiquitinating enzyme 7 isoform X1 [Alnus glutinosa]XP_062154315.1 OVARIAN TUMOR DOMAIN-containing deubiquitinating enzyme 7 isoform X1 [Alnus glutinosa]
MAKTKHQNSKPKRKPHVKKQGNVTDMPQFCAQLDALGLKILQVTADGNCFFRALADQLEGNEEEHKKYRSMVVEYILKSREMFEPFIEDDIPFNEYCQSMEEEGTWAGHMELQAASLVTHSNICIHRNMSPRWYIRNFDEHGACMVHLSYHDEEHYNSVRLKEDPSDGPARPIIIKVDADLSATAHQPKAAVARSRGGTGADIIHAGSIKMVMAGTGCQDAEKVKQVLEEVHGDVDLAIEFLIAEQVAEEYFVQTDSLHGQSDTSYGVGVDGNCEQHDEEPIEKTYLKDASSNSVKRSHGDSSSQPDDKKISRNKACPCGSKKKYKACCGAVTGRSSAKFVINQSVDSRKKREWKQGKKGGPDKAAPTCGSDGEPPDMGALCI